jgi:hypothetical protein
VTQGQPSPFGAIATDEALPATRESDILAKVMKLTAPAAGRGSAASRLMASTFDT